MSEARWTYDSYHDKWDCSSCGEGFQFMEGGPEDNDYIFCPACGREITSKETQDDLQNPMFEKLNCGVFFPDTDKGMATMRNEPGIICTCGSQRFHLKTSGSTRTLLECKDCGSFYKLMWIGEEEGER